MPSARPRRAESLPFADRRDAGRRLGAEVARLGLASSECLVLALPRGGVPVAAEVAAALDCPLDVLVARKVAMPGQPEYAIGAVVEGSDLVERRADIDLPAEAFERAVAAARAEVVRRVERYRDGRPLPDLAQRTVVVVDDGLATGATASVAVRALADRGASAVLLAVPVSAADTAARLRASVEVVVLATPSPFVAVGVWYRDFTQTDDDEVRALLAARPPHEAG